MNLFTYILAYLYPVFIVFAILLSKKKELHLHFYFFLFLLATEVVGNFMALQGNNNLFIFHLKSVIEILFFAQIFKEYIKSNKANYALNFIQVITIPIAILLIIFIDPLDQFNVAFQIIESIILILMVSYYYIKIFSKTVDLINTPSFWYATSILLYFVSNIIMFSSFYIAERIYKTGINLWIITYISSLIFIGLFIFGLYKEKKGVIPNTH